MKDPNKINGINDIYPDSITLKKELLSAVFCLEDLEGSSSKTALAQEKLIKYQDDFKKALTNQGTDLALSSLKSLRSLVATKDSSKEKSDQQSLSKGSLTVNAPSQTKPK